MKPVEIFKLEDFEGWVGANTLIELTNSMVNEWLEKDTEVRYGKEYKNHSNESYESFDGVRKDHHEFSRRCFKQEPLEPEKVKCEHDHAAILKGLEMYELIGRKPPVVICECGEPLKQGGEDE